MSTLTEVEPLTAVSSPGSRNTEPARICLLGANFINPNRGVGALASGALAVVRHTFPDGEFFIVDYGNAPSSYQAKVGDEDVSVPFVNVRFSKKFFLPNNIARLILKALFLRLLVSKAFREKQLRSDPILNLIHQSKAIISIAGGDSFSDIYGMRRLIYVSLPQVLALALGRPLVLLPQTYGPFRRGSAKAIARFIIKRAALVFCRDKDGAHTINDELGIDKNVIFSYDLGFALQPRKPAAEVVTALESIKRQGEVVGLNLSGLLHVGGYTGKNMFGLKDGYKELVADLIDLFINRYQCQVLLVPHVFGTNEESDVFACREVYQGLRSRFPGRLHFLDFELDHQEIKYVVGQTDFFLGSRMHACIAAVSQCIPTVSLAYSDKFRGVMAAAGVGDLVLDLRSEAKATLFSKIDEIYRHRADWRKKLLSLMPGIQKAVLEVLKTFGSSTR